MDTLMKCNRCMDAVLDYLEVNAASLAKTQPDGAVLGVYVVAEGASPRIVIMSFASEKAAIEYKDQSLPAALHDGSVIVPISANVAFML